ncbi:hypothetical protein AC1031_018464 [Aphanomyces cochlioides]|nr:hypothetical protein AC1031_018464 [Aphanomyces cochlioides]
MSEDPIARADVKLEAFWVSIHGRWQSHITDQRCVQKFCGLYDQVVNTNESGKTEADFVDDAIEMYRALESEEFVFIECWRVLTKSPKWSPTRKLKRTNEEKNNDQHERPRGNKVAKRDEQSLLTFNDNLKLLAEAQRKKNKLFRQSMCIKVLIENKAYDKLAEVQDKLLQDTFGIDK